MLIVSSLLCASAADKEAKVPKNKWFMNGRGYAEALELQKQTGANLLVYFERTFAKDEKGLCSWWEKKGLQHPDVQKVVDDYIKVKFSFPLSKDDQVLADKWKINKCPVVMVIQTNGWHNRVAVFDWPNGKPDLKDPKDIVQCILDASAPHEFKGRKGAADTDQPGDAKK